jgi:hypothetical protein
MRERVCFFNSLRVLSAFIGVHRRLKRFWVTIRTEIQSQLAALGADAVGNSLE